MQARLKLFALGLTVLALAACGGGGEEREKGSQAPAGGGDMATVDTAPAAPTGGAATAVNLPPGVTQAMVDEGRQIFTGQGICQTCHGPDAKGTALAPNLTDDQWINVDGSYDAIVNLVNTGVPQPKEHPAPMPPKGGSAINEQQVRAVAAYVYSISHGGS